MRLVFSLLFLALLVGCNQEKKAPGGELKTAEIIRKANIEYDIEELGTGIPHVPPLVSNGIVGACFDHMGFQSRPNTGIPEGRTVFGYIDNYYRKELGRDIQFPLAIIQAEFADGETILNLMDAKNYQQKLDIYSGVLTTSYDLFGEMEITAFAHQTIPNLFIMKIRRNSNSQSKDLRLTINCETSEAQNNDTGTSKVAPPNIKFDTSEESITGITTITNVVETDWMIHCPTAVHSVDGSNVVLDLSSGEHVIKFFVNRDDTPGENVLGRDYTELLKEHTEEWTQEWEKSWIDFPADRAHKIWTRMKYYAISHFPVINEKPLIPTGLNSNIWGFTFPQDVYYVAEMLPRIGMLDRAEKAADYWLKILPEVKEYGKRLMGVEGAYYPWTPPYSDIDQYEVDGIVGADSYELHNPAYVAAIIWHYYKYTGDKDFLKKYFPVIEEVFRFYANISNKNEDGRFDIFHEKGRGQDEASSTAGDLMNLLCSSYSAQYSAQNYVEAAKIVSIYDQSLFERANDIVSAGYERRTLLNDEGYYVTYEGDNRPKHSQKHPVQLNPIAFVPMPEEVNNDPAVKTAWKNRYDLTYKALKPKTRGWTFGEFALASCRLGSAVDLEKDISTIQLCRGADPRWIQFYESSFWPGWHLNKSYYFPMMGLFMQTFTDAVLQDWEGYINYFNCILPQWNQEPLRFKGLQSLNGVVSNGWYHNGDFEIEIIPGKSNSTKIKISEGNRPVVAEGTADGNVEFKTNELVTLNFDGQNPIVLKSVKH